MLGKQIHMMKMTRSTFSTLLEYLFKLDKSDEELGKYLNVEEVFKDYDETIEFLLSIHFTWIQRLKIMQFVIHRSTNGFHEALPEHIEQLYNDIFK